MSRTASAIRVPTNGIFSRLIASINDLLGASAQIAIRNDGPPYFEL